MEGLNIEAYDADSLRKMVRLLEYENKILKDKLKKAGISYEEVNPFEEKIESAEEYDLDQGNRIVNPPYITEKMAIRFFSMFWGREDVYARRGKNGGYFPQCANRWNDRLCPKQRKEKVLCDECENTKWISLDVKKIIDHLLGTKEDGSDVIETGVLGSLRDRKVADDCGSSGAKLLGNSGRPDHVSIGRFEKSVGKRSFYFCRSRRDHGFLLPFCCGFDGSG